MGTTAVVARPCCPVPTITVRELLSRHAAKQTIIRPPPIFYENTYRKIWKPKMLLCRGRRWMFDCGDSDQPNRHLLVSFDKAGGCTARWAPGCISACSWVDVVWAMSQLPLSKTADVPSVCLRFLDGHDSRSTVTTPAPRFTERINRVLANSCHYAVCGLRWTGHALTGHVRLKERSKWVSVSILPGLAPAFFTVLLKTPTLNP